MNFATKARLLAKADKIDFKGKPLSSLDRETLLALCAHLISERKSDPVSLLDQVFGPRR